MKNQVPLNFAVTKQTPAGTALFNAAGKMVVISQSSFSVFKRAAQMGFKLVNETSQIGTRIVGNIHDLLVK